MRTRGLFVVKTDRFFMVFPHRVGSRSITEYFYGKGRVHALQTNTWVSMDNLHFMLKETDLTRILILREPRDRLMAGRQVAKYTDKPKVMTDAGEDIMFDLHCSPWLVHLPMDIGYKYIPFESLSDYVPEGEMGYYGMKDKEKWPKRRWYKAWDNIYDEWDNELRIYEEIKNNQGSLLLPDEFKKMVADSNYINIKNHDRLRFKKLELHHYNPTDYIQIEKI